MNFDSAGDVKFKLVTKRREPSLIVQSLLYIVKCVDVIVLLYDCLYSIKHEYTV